MREILFRGKRIDNGEWIEGYYVKTVDYRTDSAVHLIIELPSAFYPRGEIAREYEINSSTIGQFTGLTDKNGRKIFEGDICRMKADRLKGYGAIIFMGSAFVLCDKTHKQTRYYPLYPDGQFTVVGNIHDNPEMLEVTK